ncbi:MAG: hypothetical protein R3A79_11440 [Nannocystaceae bacterium]
MTPRRSPPLLLRLAAGLTCLPLALVACESGDDVATSQGEVASTSGGEVDDASSTSTTGDASDSDDDSGSTTAADDANPFDLDRETVRLLPYAVRLNRLTLLVDRPASDPIFAEMDKRRFDLGDYDHSQGVNPDLAWTATRMANWIAALRPICSSAVFKERYPELPLDLPELMHDAYGFTPTADEVAPFAALFDGLEENPDPEDMPGDDKGTGPLDPLSAETRYETACLGVLSSLEFVAQ